MHFKLLGLSLVTGMMSATAFAEPAIQPGDTLESLSKVKVSTAVNGQAGSIEELVASGQIRIVDAGQVATKANAASSETAAQARSASDATVAQSSEMSEINTAAQVDSSSAQANESAIEQTAQAVSDHVDQIQPNSELAAQQAEQGSDQQIATAPVNQSAADAQVNAANMPQAELSNESAAAAPANHVETTATQEAFAATPEATQPDDAVQAAPEAAVIDAPVKVSPEVPMTEATEN